MTNTSWNGRAFLLPGLLALAAAAALSVDVPIATTFRPWVQPVTPQDRTIHAYLGYFDMFEPFGHGLGVALVLIALHQLDPSRRWAIPRVICCALAAGGTANLIKMCIARLRPNDLPDAFHGTVWDTFGQWFPWLSADSGWQSFPSAHTATACGFAAALIWLYPNGRKFFSALVILVGCQRIASGAHNLSDVLAGAAAGCLVAILILKVGLLPVWFDRWEQRWKPEGDGGGCRK
jgi:membrane-associated phospholipid phosphatase